MLESNDFIPQKEIVRFPIPKLVYRFLLKIMPKYGAKFNFLLIYLTSLGNTEQIFNVCEKSMFQLITPKQIEHSMYSVGVLRNIYLSSPNVLSNTSQLCRGGFHQLADLFFIDHQWHWHKWYVWLLRHIIAQLTYPEFPLKARLRVIVSSACIKHRQLKIERMLTVLTGALSWALSGFGNTFTLEKRLRV